MSTDHVMFAVLVPKTMSELNPPNPSDGKTTVKGELREATKSDQSLDFDLSSLGELAWYAVKIIGPGAAAVAYGLIANYLFEKTKQVSPDPENFTLLVRLPSGRRIKFNSEDIDVIEDLKKQFEEQTT